MATPFGSGVAALYLERDPTMTPAQVGAVMQADGSVGVVQSSGSNSPNILLSTVNLRASVERATPTTPTPTSGPTLGPTPQMSQVHFIASLSTQQQIPVAAHVPTPVHAAAGTPKLVPQAPAQSPVRAQKCWWGFCRYT